MRLVVDPWDPSYGTSVDADALADTSVDVDVDVEIPADRWEARSPSSSVTVPGRIVFIDGVRRVDARVWVDDGDGGDGDAGLCASWAAGAVRCDGVAEVVAVDVERGLFSASPLASDVVTHHGTYAARRTETSSPDALSLALQAAMANSERLVAARANSDDSAGLLVVDGPLRLGGLGRDAIGFVKTHHISYLADRPRQVLHSLDVGTRTPAFTLGGGFRRHAWYLRLAAGGGAPMSGVVRCECAASVALADLVALADATTAVLPAFASEAHKDARAPQNLYPIGGLERELRHRLGDAELLYRALRQAAG
jgi:hypothetical protein